MTHGLPFPGWYTFNMFGFPDEALSIFAIVGWLLYFPTNHIIIHGHRFFHDTAFDAKIPIIPWFVIPYVGLLPYALVCMYVVWSSPYKMEFLLSIAIAAWSAGVTWYFFPAGKMRKRRVGLDFFSHMISWIYRHDAGNDKFPSSHVFYAILFSFYFSLALPAWTPLFITIGCFIAISTVLVKQHRVIDIFGGVVWAIAAIMIARIIM